MATNLLNTKQVMALFGVSHVTTYSWRQGSATRDALPTAPTKGRDVRFKLGDLKAWARKHHVQMVRKPEDVLKTPSVKPGPKRKPH